MEKSELAFFKKIITSKPYIFDDFVVNFIYFDSQHGKDYFNINVTSRKDVCWSYDALTTVGHNIMGEVINMMGGIEGSFPLVYHIVIDGDEIHPGAYYVTDNKDKEIFNTLKNVRDLILNHDDYSLNFQMKLVDYRYEFNDDRVIIYGVYDMPIIKYTNGNKTKIINDLPKKVISSLNSEIFEYVEDESYEDSIRDIEQDLYDLLRKEFYFDISDTYVSFTIQANTICGKSPMWLRGDDTPYLDYFNELISKSVN